MTWVDAAMAVFICATVGTGHLLGGPDRVSAAALVFAVSCRHPAAAAPCPRLTGTRRFTAARPR